MQFAGTVLILFGVAFWAGHTHKVRSWEPRPPEVCQAFDLRYAPRYKAMCDEARRPHSPNRDVADRSENQE